MLYNKNGLISLLKIYYNDDVLPEIAFKFRLAV